jgi:SAM-dependent methyltransferase
MNLKWSLRRLNVPVSKNALVLEIGSGNNPYPRSNVLSDLYEETGERGWTPLTSDRKLVLCSGENLPFKDKAFDYVIASHVLEHAINPEKFLMELQRVAHAGYIETPDAFMERINPYTAHRLEITVRNNTLLIRKKPSWLYDNDLVELYEARAKEIITKRTIPTNPFEFHMRYYWNGIINYKIINPECNSSWVIPDIPKEFKLKKQLISLNQLREIAVNLLKRIFTQRKRNNKIDIFPLLRCTICHSENLSRLSVNDIFCNQCNETYKISGNIFNFIRNQD